MKGKKLALLSIVLFLIVTIIWLWARSANSGAMRDIEVLFAGWAFLGIIIAVIIQAQELRLQIDELRETKDQVRRSAIAQEQAHVALLKQLDSMNKAALLNGYSTMITFYSQDASYGTPWIYHKDAINHCRARIDQLTKDIEANVKT